MSATIAKSSTPIGRGAMSVSEGARYCGINEYFLYRLLKNGGGPRVVRIGRRILLRQVDLDAWLESRVEGNGDATGC